MLKMILADLAYMIQNVREFGIKTIPADFEYMMDNIKEERYRRNA